MTLFDTIEKRTAAKRIAAVVLQLLLGLFFAGSAVAKLIEIDSFEVYLYSFGLLPLPVALVLARVVIVVELVLGLMLLAGVGSRVGALLLLLLTVVFSCFLCYAILVGRMDSCHCMGALVQLPPALSLVKNSVAVLLLIVLLRCGMLWQWGARWYVYLLLAVSSTAAVFAISLPDNWMFSSAEREPYNAELLHEVLQPGQPLGDSGIGEGRKLVVFATEGCPYCRRTLQKLNAMALRHVVDTSCCVVVTPEHEPKHAVAVADQPPVYKGRRYKIDNSLFLHLTAGRRPIVLLLDNEGCQASYHYRNIDERQIAEFFR